MTEEKASAVGAPEASTGPAVDESPEGVESTEGAESTGTAVADGDVAARVETAELAALYEVLATERRKVEDYLGQIQRLKADFDNYRRRMMQEQARWQDQAVGQFVLQVLPVLDNLERAAASGNSDTAALRQGLELTLRQFRDTLEKAGVEPIEAVGQPFDPNVHEAMMRVDGEGMAEDTVLEEFQKGYMYKGQVLRPTLVKVAVRG